PVRSRRGPAPPCASACAPANMNASRRRPRPPEVRSMADRFDADRWIADRVRPVEASGIRKVFELARSLQDPVNLSIGQPDFDVPPPVKAAAHAAIDAGHNGYTVTQGIPELRAK